MNRLDGVQLRRRQSGRVRSVACLGVAAAAVLGSACSSSDGGDDDDPSSPDGVTVIDGPAQVDDSNGGAEPDG